MVGKVPRTYMAHWFPERIEQLCKELGLTKSRLGQEAGLSHATIAKWIRTAEAGQFNPRLEQVELLAKHTGRPVMWFLSEDGAEAPPPDSGATDTLSLADQAATHLTQYDGVTPEEAWSLMRKLVGRDATTFLPFYFEARDILGKGPVSRRHSDRINELARGVEPRRRVKTS